MVIVVPINAISRTQVSLDIPHRCGWFVGSVLGLGFVVYSSVPHSSMIPLARSPLDIVFDSAK